MVGTVTDHVVSFLVHFAPLRWERMNYASGSAPTASARPAAAPAPSSAAASGASSSSFHSRQQQEDAALLTLNTLLHAMVGKTLAIDCKDDRTVRGCLKKADNYMKCVAVAQTAPSPNQASTHISSTHILDPRLMRCWRARAQPPSHRRRGEHAWCR